MPDWRVGDVAMVRPELRHRILVIAYDEERDETTWTVEPVRSGQQRGRYARENLAGASDR